jgi:ATP-dependent Clp protease adaptor protein ClpS
MNTEIDVLEQVEITEKTILNNEIVLYNDDVNTFDHVIETLIIVCEHTAEQAEQCAILVHYKGKCTVKTGSMKELVPKCLLLLDAGLSAEIV